MLKFSRKSNDSIVKLKHTHTHNKITILLCVLLSFFGLISITSCNTKKTISANHFLTYVINDKKILAGFNEPYQYSWGDTLVIPSDIDIVAHESFVSLNNIKHLICNSSHATFDQYSFSYSGLIDITINDFSGQINSYAFIYLDNCESLTISSNSDAQISNYAFAVLPNIKRLDLQKYFGSFARYSFLDLGAELTVNNVLLGENGRSWDAKYSAFMDDGYFWTTYQKFKVIRTSNMVCVIRECPDNRWYPPEKYEIAGRLIFGNITNEELDILDLGNSEFTDWSNDFGQSIFEFCSGIRNISISKGNDDFIYWLPTFAFQGCTNLNKLEITNSKIFIGEGCFSESSLRTINISSSVGRVGSRSFAWLDNLTYLDLTNISIYFTGECFLGDTNLLLENVVFPEDYTYEDETVSYDFSVVEVDGIKGLRAKDREDLQYEFYPLAFGDFVLSDDNLSDYSWTDIDDKIETANFGGTNITSVDFSNLTEDIVVRYCGFEYTDIRSVILSNHVDLSKAECFGDCFNLSEVNIHPSNDLAYIGDIYYETFVNDYALSTFDFDDFVGENIYSAAFYGTNISNLDFSNKSFYIDSYCFAHSPITSLNLDNFTGIIERYAFSDCHLENLTISNSINDITEGAFAYNSLNSLIIKIYDDYEGTFNNWSGNNIFYLSQNMNVNTSITIQDEDDYLDNDNVLDWLEGQFFILPNE